MLCPGARRTHLERHYRICSAAGQARGRAFENKIRPVLVKECYSCHAVDTKKGPKGGLLLDSRVGLLKGGNSGVVIVPGKPTESLLLKALHGDGVEQMPPKGKLSDDVISDFEKWVKMGAPDPRIGTAAVAGMDIEKGRQFWSFQQTKSHTPPAVKDAAWPISDIDRFLLASLEGKGLRPAPDADPQVLIRRLYIDLVGYPPAPAKVDQFLKDCEPLGNSTFRIPQSAIEKVVDHLLASPRFGERWGRHWLDLARYADSNGKDENLTFHDAYRYRDYVIRCLQRRQAVQPFHRRTTRRRPAPRSRPRPRDEQLTATGFLVIGPKVLAERDKPKLRMDVVDEQIDTIGKAFMGLTLGCARCHDHKFDPVPTADYYALAGILMSTRTLDGIKLGNTVVSGWMLRPLGGPESEKIVAAGKEFDAKLKKVQDDIKKVKANLSTAQDKAAMRSPAELAGITVDDKEAKLVGMWKASLFSKPYVGDGYIHDDRSGKGEKSATFTPKLPKAGEYEVLLSYTPGTNRPRTPRSRSRTTAAKRRSRSIRRGSPRSMDCSARSASSSSTPAPKAR